LVQSAGTDEAYQRERCQKSNTIPGKMDTYGRKIFQTIPDTRKISDSF
jgi:hypothetical protein